MGAGFAENAVSPNANPAVTTEAVLRKPRRDWAEANGFMSGNTKARVDSTQDVTKVENEA